MTRFILYYSLLFYLLTLIPFLAADFTASDPAGKYEGRKTVAGEFTGERYHLANDLFRARQDRKIFAALFVAPR